MPAKEVVTAFDEVLGADEAHAYLREASAQGVGGVPVHPGRGVGLKHVHQKCAVAAVEVGDIVVILDVQQVHDQPLK